MTLFFPCVFLQSYCHSPFAFINNSFYHLGAEVNVMACTFSSSPRALISTTAEESYYLKKQ